MSLFTHEDAESWGDIPIENPFQVPQAQASQQQREETLATLFTQCPEITELTRSAKGQDVSALVAMIAIARLSAADPVEFRWEINLCADVLRQRVQSGMLGDTKAFNDITRLMSEKLDASQVKDQILSEGFDFKGL